MPDTSSVAIVTNIPAPYRIPVFNRLAEIHTGPLRVFYCSGTEPNRQWSLPDILHESRFLKQQSNGYIHTDFSIIRHLSRFSPEVVISCGFSPSFLFAAAWAMENRRIHIPFTDGTVHSESRLSPVHRILRQVVYQNSSAFIGASQQSLELYKSYDIPARACFQSVLPIDLKRYTAMSRKTFDEREFDLLFSGQFIRLKMPDFFVQVCSAVTARTGSSPRILVIGDGPEKTQFLNSLQMNNLQFRYDGFVSQDQLPQKYNRSKLLLFPTASDTWGIVANEAMASGTPVISCNNAGAAGELILHNQNGLILPLDIDMWSANIETLLSSPSEWERLSAQSLIDVNRFSFDAAAAGIESAIQFALSHPK